MAALRSGLIDIQCSDVPVVDYDAFGWDVVVKHSPDAFATDIEKIGDGPHRHSPLQRDHVGNEQLAEAAHSARLGDGRLSGLAEPRIWDAGNGGVDEFHLLSKAQMLPTSGPHAMDGLIQRIAERAGKLASCHENHAVNLLGPSIKAYVCSHMRFPDLTPTSHVPALVTGMELYQKHRWGFKKPPLFGSE